MVNIYIHHGVLRYVSRSELISWGYAGVIVDNGYLEYGYPRLDILVSRILRYRPEAAIGPDSDWKGTLYIKRRFPQVKVIYPIHYEDDLNNVDTEKVDYVGYPTLSKVRYFSLKWYLRNVPRERRFMLGFMVSDIPLLVAEFAAGDTVYPQYCSFYGKDIYGRKRFSRFSDALKYNLKEFIKLIQRKASSKPLMVTTP